MAKCKACSGVVGRSPGLFESKCACVPVKKAGGVTPQESGNNWLIAALLLLLGWAAVIVQFLATGGKL